MSINITTFGDWVQVTSYGLNERDEVHELEFLSLLAFLAREAISSNRMNLSKAKKFSPNDLEMAYAFHSKFGTGAVPKQPPMLSPNFDGHQKHLSPNHPHYRMDTSPQHVLNTSGHHQQDGPSVGHGQMQLGQSAFRAQMPMRDYPGHGESLGEQPLHQSGHEVPGHNSMLQQSARYSGQMLGGPTGHPQLDRDEQRISMLLAANERQPGPHYSSQHGLVTPEHDKKMMPMQLYPQERQPHPPQGGRDVLDSSRASGEQQLAICDN